MQDAFVAGQSGVFASCLQVYHQQSKLLHAGYLFLWGTRCLQGCWHEPPELGLRRALAPSQMQMANPSTLTLPLPPHQPPGQLLP